MSNKTELLYFLEEMKKAIKEVGYIHPKSQTLEDFLRLNEKVYKLKLKTLKERRG